MKDHDTSLTKALIAAAVLACAMFLPGQVLGQNLPKGSPGWMEWGPKYCAERPVRGGTLRIASPVYVGLMNPNHFPVLDWGTMSFMYEKLILLDSSYRPTIPWLAESWEFVDDLTVVMRLRRGVRFHDGTAFNARSLKYQMDWIMDRDNAAWTRAWIEPLKSVEVVDEYTVKWRFRSPWGAFLGTMASVPGYMVSARALEADAAQVKVRKIQRDMVSVRRRANDARDTDMAALAKKQLAEMETRIRRYSVLAKNARPLDTNPVGTGPYMLGSASTDNYVQLKRNPDWWFGKSVGMPDMPYFDGIRVSVIPDPSVRLANLKAGKLDYIVLDAVQYRMVQNDRSFAVSTFPINWVVYVTFNHAKGPCSDIRVRKAISHAIDRKALVMGTQFGLGRLSSCVYPDDHWARNPELRPVSYDPGLSRKLLAQAGYANGLTIRGFTLNIPEAQAYAKALMAMLEKVGITWKPVFLNVTGIMDPFTRLDFDIIANVHPWIQEPDHVATLLYDPASPFNNGRSRNGKAIALIRAGRHAVNEGTRTKIYHDLEKALYENYEDAWLWWPVAVLAANRNIRGHNEGMLKLYGEGFLFSHPQWFKDGHP